MAQTFLEPEEDGWHSVEEIAALIRFIRGKWVLIDEHLADVLGVPLSQLHDAFTAREPVPGEFRFSVESRPSVRGKCGGAHFVFTEHGALVAAMVLEGPGSALRAVQLVRAFIRRRQRVEVGLRPAERSADACWKRSDTDMEVALRAVRPLRSQLLPRVA